MGTQLEPSTQYAFQASVICHSWSAQQSAGDSIQRIHDDMVNAVGSLGTVTDCQVNVVPNMILPSEVHSSWLFTPSTEIDSASLDAKILYGANYLSQQNALPEAYEGFTPIGFGVLASVIDESTITPTQTQADTAAPLPRLGANPIDAVTSGLSTVTSSQPTYNGHTVAGIATQQAAQNVTQAFGLTPSPSLLLAIEIAGGIAIGCLALFAIGYALNSTANLRRAFG